MGVNTVYNDALRNHNGHLTHEDAVALLAEARSEDKASSGCCSVGTKGSDKLFAILQEHSEQFDITSDVEDVKRFLAKGGYNVGGSLTMVDATSTTVAKGVAKHRTWSCDWFPMVRRENAPGIHLWSAGGPFEKFDRLIGSKSVAYEVIAHSSGPMWAGHCDMAAGICSLLEEPKRDVTITLNEVTQTFTKHDIQGLLVAVSNDLRDLDNEPMLGNRNNGNPTDDPSDPYPHILMPLLAQWIKEGSCFVLDIDNGTPVWNYAFDEGNIQQYASPQNGMKEVPALNGGVVKYQTWDLQGRGYDAEKRHYMSWVEYVDDKPVASGWFGNPRDTKRNPDFAWKPVARGDLRKKENWPKSCSYNPHIDPQVVYDIYSRSI